MKWFWVLIASVLLSFAGAGCLPAVVSNDYPPEINKEIAEANAWVAAQPPENGCYAWVELKQDGTFEVLTRCTRHTILV